MPGWKGLLGRLTRSCYFQVVQKGSRLRVNARMTATLQGLGRRWRLCYEESAAKAERCRIPTLASSSAAIVLGRGAGVSEVLLIQCSRWDETCEMHLIEVTNMEDGALREAHYPHPPESVTAIVPAYCYDVNDAAILS